MKLFRTRHIIDELEDLLDRERRAILDADFAFLKRIFVTKERLLIKIQKEPEFPDNLVKLGEKISQNQKLLESSAKGIRAVVNSMNIPNQPKIPFHTYDKSGHRWMHLGRNKSKFDQA
ncbi:MAG: hypothetical protein ACU0CA_02620 [Paracoccaceae bacterium]